MQATTHRPRVLVARSVIDLLQHQGARPQLQLSGPHHQAIGGILIGKRVAGDAVAVLAASTPGPAPDNRQLGFALDQGLANATLEQWFARDAAADFLGLWHTDPGGIARPTAADIEVARRLLVDPAYNLTEVVNLILYVDRAVPTIRAFYLNHASPPAAPVGFAAYEVLDDNHPLLAAEKVASPTGPAATSVPPASLPLRWPLAGRRLTAIAALLIMILVVAFAMFRRSPTHPAGSDPLLAGESGSSTPAAALTTPSTTADAAQTALATPADVVPLLSVTPDAATETPSAAAEVSPTPSASATAGTVYALQFDPMDAAYRQGFLRRLQLAKCVGCYNVDLVSPVPFREMRLKIAGSTSAPFSNFAAPSPLQLPARPQPYTLQAFDLQGNALSDPVSLAINTGSLYVLRIVPR